MSYRLVEVDVRHPASAIALTPEETGIGLLARRGDRLLGFAMLPYPANSRIEAGALQALLAERFAEMDLAAQTEDEMRSRWPGAPAPARSLTIAICTKDRAVRLARLLDALTALRNPGFAAVEIIVVDNAPSDDATAQAVQRYDGVRYVCEPQAGLNFARNAALHAAAGDYLAFLDDDVVIDRCYLEGLLHVCRARPDAGGFTGLVLPYKLDTEAQIHFEARGGFGRGFLRTDFRNARWGNPLHPVGAGILGAGCNMCFDRALLLQIGGFDEALDTGAPLPGGGDLDIFYRVLRTGRPMVYEPAYAVYHEHRETLAQLKRQYWTWGLGFMAYLTKCRRADPELAARHSAMAWWWVIDRLGAMAGAALRGQGRALSFAWAELWGGIQGWAGEYDRSLARSQAIRQRAA